MVRRERLDYGLGEMKVKKKSGKEGGSPVAGITGE